MCRRNQQIFDATLCPLILDCSFYCKYHHFKIISPNICKIIWTFEKEVYFIPISLPRLSVYICDSLGRSSMVLSLKSFFSSFLYYLFIILFFFWIGYFPVDLFAFTFTILLTHLYSAEIIGLLHYPTTVEF